MTSYSVAGELCDTRLQAIKAHVGAWIAMVSPDQMATLDANEEADEFMRAYKQESEDGKLLACVVGKVTWDGESIYHDLEPTREEILEIIEECIREAREDVDD